MPQNNSRERKTVREVLENNPIRDNPAARENLVVNLPNMISALRIGSAPVLLWLAWQGMHNYYLMVLLAAVATDGIDGYLARKLNQVTRLGAQMDSWADLIIYSVMLFGLIELWPDIYAREAGFLVVAFSCWVVSVLFAVVRFHRLPSYHTYASKFAAICLTPAYFVLVIWGYDWPFRLVMLFFIWISVEQVIITAILDQWRGNVASFWHALHLVRDKERSSNLD